MLHQRHPLKAIIDIEASLTRFSFETWEHLGFPYLEACNDNFLSFDCSTSCCLRSLTCRVKTQHITHMIRARVLPPKVLYMPCLLGLDWCYISECLLSPSKNIVSFHNENGVKFEKLVATTLKPCPTNLGKLQSVNLLRLKLNIVQHVNTPFEST